MTAGIETLRLLKQKYTYIQLRERSSIIEKEAINAAGKARIGVHVSKAGSIFTIFFTDKPVRDYTSAKWASSEMYSKFSRASRKKL